MLGATLALSGCGAQQAGAAAIVNDRVISDQDVQNVAKELTVIIPDGQKLSSTETLFSLILAPYVSAEADRAHKTVSVSEARKAIDKVADPAPATIEFVRMQLGFRRLDQASKVSIANVLRKAKITINPRYGTFDAKQIAMIPTSPNWIKASAPSPAK